MKKQKRVSLHHLIKFGCEKHVKTLYEHGILYLNTIEYFRTLEEEGFARGDSYEGTTMVSNITDGKVYTMVDGKEHLLVIASHLHVHGYKEYIKGNLFCMYAIHPGVIQGGTFKFDERVKEFGSHCVVKFTGRG